MSYLLKNSRKKHAIVLTLIIYAISMAYFIFLFSVDSDLCRYFFQNVKKTDGGWKNDIKEPQCLMISSATIKLQSHFF